LIVFDEGCYCPLNDLWARSYKIFLEVMELKKYISIPLWLISIGIFLFAMSVYCWCVKDVLSLSCEELVWFIFETSILLVIIYLVGFLVGSNLKEIEQKTLATKKSKFMEKKFWTKIFIFVVFLTPILALLLWTKQLAIIWDLNLQNYNHFMAIVCFTALYIASLYIITEKKFLPESTLKGMAGNSNIILAFLFAFTIAVAIVYAFYASSNWIFNASLVITAIFIAVALTISSCKTGDQK